MLGLPCSVGSSSVVTVNTGCSVAVVLRFLLSLVAERRLWGLWASVVGAHVGSVLTAHGPQSTGSVVVGHGLCCSVYTMWDLPRSWIKLVSLTTRPPGKPQDAS